MTDHYRRLVGQDEWHFCINCSKWPTDDYVLSKTKPVTDKLCNECQTKQQAGDAAYPSNVNQFGAVGHGSEESGDWGR